MISNLFSKLELNSAGCSSLKTLREIGINFGPQHPSSHGVLRLLVQLSGEIVDRVDPQIGFLHRGTEKLVEYQTLHNVTVFMDRLDYTSVLTQTHCFCLAAESAMLRPNLNMTTVLTRTIFDELARLLNHLLSIATHSLDVGTMGPLFWAFEEREHIMELFEYVSGARMHTALYQPNQNLTSLLTPELLLKLSVFLRNCYKTFTEMYVALYNNRVWKHRLATVGVLGAETAKRFGATGPVLRSTGVRYDIRLLRFNSYAFYRNLSIRSFVGVSGDCFDRYLIRSRELFESIRIIYLCVSELTYFNTNKKIILHDILSKNYRSTAKLRLESLIRLFRHVNADYKCINTIVYNCVESGKGEFGITLITNFSNKPYRLAIRSPAYAHLQLLNLMSYGHYFADIATLIGSLDVVFGEIDR